MDSSTRRVAVVGQGVMGLTSALRLLTLGYVVDIYSKDQFIETTSMSAGAYWWPHKAYPEHRVKKWAKETYDVFKEASSTPETGIRFEEHFRFCLDPDDGAYVRDLVDEWEEIEGADYGIACPEAYKLKVPVIDVPLFMPHLRDQVIQAGGRILIKALASPAELFPTYDLVINCTGVWAHHFVGDNTVFPIRGQAVRMTRPAGLKASTRIFEKEDTFTLILPRSTDMILGGTAGEGEWDRTPNEADTVCIIERCKSIVPQIAHATLLGTSVGLRPGRKEIRLALEMMAPNQPIIHNYGHGGGGFTVSWGCANEVAELTLAYFN